MKHKFLSFDKIKFTLSSIICAVVDLVIFSLLKEHLPFAAILIATVTARIVSASLNFIINKLWSFKNHEKKASQTTVQILKFAVLFIVKMLASAGLVKLLSDTVFSITLGNIISSLINFIFRKDWTVSGTTLIKIIVDTILFFANYAVQKYWIFRHNKTSAENSTDEIQIQDKKEETV